VGGLVDMHRWLQAGSRLLHLPVHQVFYHLGRREASRRQLPLAPEPVLAVRCCCIMHRLALPACPPPCLPPCRSLPHAAAN
jgi:hypothetical protein